MTATIKKAFTKLKEGIICSWLLLGCAGWATLWFVFEVMGRFHEFRIARILKEIDGYKRLLGESTVHSE